LIIVDTIDRRIVIGLKTAEQLIFLLESYTVKDRLEVTRTPFGGSTGLARELGQFYWFIHASHDTATP